MTIYKGKTTEDAIEKGLKDLALDKNKVKIEVKHQGNTGVFGLFASEAIVDIRPLTEKEIQHKKYQKIFMIVGVTIAIVAFVCIGIFSSSKENSNELSLPIESENINQKNYKVIVSQLEDTGFTNVKTEKIEDLINGWLIKDGQIESVSIQGKTEFQKGQKIPKNARITVTYHTFKEDTTNSTKKKDNKKKENSSSSSIDTKSSSSSSESSSSSSESSKKPEPQTITPDNNPEFAAILQTEDPTAISSFVQKYKGKTVEFNGYIAYLNPHANYKTRYDILIYTGDYPGPDLATPGPAFQFNDIAPTSVFKNFGGDGVGIGQNMHIKASVREFTKGELLILDPVEVTKR